MTRSRPLGSLALWLLACAQAHAPRGNSELGACASATECNAFGTAPATSSAGAAIPGIAATSGAKRGAAMTQGSGVTHDAGAAPASIRLDAATPQPRLDAAQFLALDARAEPPVVAASADEVVAELVVSSGTSDDDAGPTASVPCDQPFSAEILSPGDGATGVSTYLMLQYRLSDPSIPTTYATFWASQGLTVQSIDARTVDDLTWLTLRLAPSTTYVVEIGWICMPGTDSNRRIPLAKVAFRTAP